MDSVIIVVGNLILFLIAVPILFFFASKFITGPFASYKRKSTFFTMQEVVSSITSVCEVQFKIYDNNRFREAGPMLTNSSFDNYYNELCKKCLNSLSDEFYDKASMFMSEDAIALMISEYVRNYLTAKIGIDDSANYDENEEGTE